MVAAFHWNKSFITDLPEVDQQHKHLVTLINQLGNSLAEDGISHNYVKATFQELAEYAVYHFRSEEKLMSETGIDQRHFAFHIKEHVDFLQEVTSMHAAISSDSPDTADHLLEFLTRWLAYHILGTDQNMARQVRAIESGSAPANAYLDEEQKRDDATEPLLAALNSLFRQVTARNRELVQLNQTLEAKVAERTKALSEANIHLEELSLTDVLTGLPNRRHGIHHLTTLWNESLHSGAPLACMMVDADHFKEVNDSYGHDAGDKVLRKLAETLQNSVQNSDIVCRLGGDEFFIICPGRDRKEGLHIAEALRKKVSELRVPTGDGIWHGSISIGLSVRSSGMKDYEALIKSADNGVYEAKRAGKNCVKTEPRLELP